MKRAAFVSLGIVAGLLASAIAPMVFGQDAPDPTTIPTYSTVVPLNSSSSGGGVRAAVTTGSSSIPMWTYSVNSPIDGNTYSGQMVGASPYMNGARTTNIPTMVIPIVVQLADGSTYDPTVNNTKCSSWGSALTQVLNSPLLQNHAYTMNGINMGTGQYVDEFQRANFYSANVSETGDSYHTILSPTVLPAVTVQIPAGFGQQYWFGCSPIAVMDFATFDAIIQRTILPSLATAGVTTATFPLLVLNNAVMANPGTSLTSHCCLTGYHGAYASGNTAQTYAVADFDTSKTFTFPDIQPMSNQVAAWMDNPLGTNSAPAWGHIGQLSTACSSALEAGYPLNGTPPGLYSESGIYGVTMPNRQTYYPQELAFTSWFFRAVPSTGAGGIYSDGGLFLSAQKTLCTL